MDNCTGQAWRNHDFVRPADYALIILAAVGPHPDVGADGSGDPIRLALFVPDTPNAVILPDIQEESYSEYDRSPEQSSVSTSASRIQGCCSTP